jgi:hypothetical protein
MSDYQMTVRYDKCYTITSRGQPRQRWPGTIRPLMTYPTASASHIGHGTDFKFNTPRLTYTTPLFAPKPPRPAYTRGY